MVPYLAMQQAYTHRAYNTSNERPTINLITHKLTQAYVGLVASSEPGLDYERGLRKRTNMGKLHLHVELLYITQTCGLGSQ